MSHFRGKFVLELAGLLLSGLAVLFVVLLLRFTQGPVRLDFLKPIIVRHIDQRTGFQMDFSHMAVGSAGWGAPIQIHLQDAAFRTVDGASTLQVQSIGAELAFRDLVYHHAVKLMHLTVVHPKLVAVRRADGTYQLTPQHAPPTASRQGDTDPLRQLLTPDPAGPLSLWRDLSISDGEIVLDDAAGAALLDIGNIQFALNRKSTGAVLNATASINAGETPGSLFAFAEFDESRHGTLKLHVTPVPIDVVAGLFPSLDSARSLQVPVAIDVNADTNGFHPSSGNVVATIGAGQIVDGSRFPAPVAIHGGHIAATYTSDPEAVKITDFQIALDGPRLTVTGGGNTENGVAKLDTTIALANVAIDSLEHYWPYGTSQGGRAWVTSNLSKGMITQATAHITASAPRGDLSNITVAGLDGVLNVENATVHYFGGLPAVTGVDGAVDYDLHSLTVHPTAGNDSGLVLSNGNIVVQGLDQQDQAIAIDLTLTGPVASAFTILDSPPLHYARNLKLDPHSIGGTAVTQFHMDFPLLADLPTSLINLHTESTLSGVSLPHVVRGLPLSSLNGKLVVDQKGLDLQGRGTLGQTPLTLDYKQSFDSAARPIADATFEGDLSDAGRVELGIDAPDRLAGPVGIKGRYLDYGTTGTVDIHSDLADADFKIDEIAYEKPRGAAGKASFVLRLENGGLNGIDDISIDTDGFHTKGSAQLDPQSGKLTSLHLDPLHVANTSLAVDISSLPAGGSHIVLKGGVFDARAFLQQRRKPTPEPRQTAQGDSAPLEIETDIGWVQTSDAGGLRNVKGRISLAGQTWKRAEFTADAAGHPINLAYLPDGNEANPSYTLHGDTEDAGAALSGMGLTGSISGGMLHVEGKKPAPTVEAPEPPLSGTLKVDDFTVTNPPVFARLFNLLSIKGFMDTVSGNGIRVKTLSTDFAVRNGIVKLDDGKVVSSSIGLTIDGSIDRKAGTLDLHGDAVPAYGVNTFLRRIPLLGYLLTGSDGEGVFSTTYSITGPMDNPSVFANPVAILLPGVLRDMVFEWPWNND